MRSKMFKWPIAALFGSCLLALISCSPAISGQEEVVAMTMPDGAIIVDTVTTTATVTAIDTAKRKLTLVFEGGAKTTYKAGPEVVNFPQIQVGDKVKATVTEEAAIYIGHGAPPSEMVGNSVALAPMGAKPGGIMVDTMQVTAKVTAVDAKARKVSLEFPDGTTKKVRVGKQVDLAAVKPGDDVTVQVSEGIALAVQKP